MPESSASSRVISPVLWIRSAVVITFFVALLYVVEAVDTFMHGSLDTAGIQPREVNGLGGILVAPMLHTDFTHLAANTVPALVLGFLVLVAQRFVAVTTTVWAASGLGVWLTSPAHTVTVGLSGVIFGWLSFLLVRGLFNRSAGQVALGVALFVLYGSVLWGLLPGSLGISWQAHAFGALGGVIAAWLLSRRDRRRRRPPPAQVLAAGRGVA